MDDERPLGWAYRRTFTVDHRQVKGVEDLVDFPLYIDLENKA